MMAECSDCLGMVRSEPVEGERAVRLVEYVELCPRHASMDALEAAAVMAEQAMLAILGDASAPSFRPRELLDAIRAALAAAKGGGK